MLRRYHSIPSNPPTNFHPDLIATILQRCLPLLCALLSQQSHLFPTYNHSRKDLHKLCQIPTQCQRRWLQASYSAPRTFASSFVFPQKFLFCTNTTGSIGWPSPAPRLHTGDCFEIRNLHWGLCDPRLLNHQFFRFWHDCTSTSSARSPCYFCPQADVTISIFQEVYHFCSRLHW